VRRRRVGALLALVVAGCLPVAAAEDRVQLRNETTTPVAVHVNGGWVGTYPAGAVVDVPIVGHGGPPFAVEVRSPSGALLTSVTLTAEDRRTVADGSTSMSSGGDVGCGWIEISYGGSMPPEPNVGGARPPAAGVCP
jgi:hypothetical protein